MSLLENDSSAWHTGRKHPKSIEADAESAYSQRYELARHMIDSSIDVMIVLDNQSRVIEWNKAAEGAAGLRYDAVVWRPFFEIFPAARAITGYEFAMINALAGKKCFAPASQRFYLNGYYETHFVPLKKDSAPASSAVLLILHDVAHRVKAEDKLRNLNRELTLQNAALRDAHEEIATLAKMTAYDLGAPLCTIGTLAAQTAEGDGPAMTATGKANLERIREVSREIGLRAQAIIDFGNMGRECSFEELDLTALLQHELTVMDETIRQTGIRIRFEKLPVLLGFRSAMVELLRQLLDNAIKFRRAGVQTEIVITCDQVEGYTIRHVLADKDQDYYHLCVKDNGIGFNMEESPAIFEMFRRLDPKATHCGSGIGLSIALKAARLHDGFIIAESVPDAGSSFHVYLPRH